MTARTAADLIHGRAASRNYRDIAERLDAEGRRRQAIGAQLTARIYLWWAAIARRAAVAEEVDEEPRS